VVQKMGVVVVMRRRRKVLVRKCSGWGVFFPFWTHFVCLQQAEEGRRKKKCFAAFDDDDDDDVLDGVFSNC